MHLAGTDRGARQISIQGPELITRRDKDFLPQRTRGSLPLLAKIIHLVNRHSSGGNINELDNRWLCIEASGRFRGYGGSSCYFRSSHQGSANP